MWRIATSLDMGSGTLERILAEERSATLVPVRIVDDGAGHELASGIVVHGGCGVTVEGLGIQDVAVLLRALS